MKIQRDRHAVSGEQENPGTVLGVEKPELAPLRVIDYAAVGQYAVHVQDQELHPLDLFFQRFLLCTPH